MQIKTPGTIPVPINIDGHELVVHVPDTAAGFVVSAKGNIGLLYTSYPLFPQEPSEYVVFPTEDAWAIVPNKCRMITYGSIKGDSGEEVYVDDWQNHLYDMNDLNQTLH